MIETLEAIVLGPTIYYGTITLWTNAMTSQYRITYFRAKIRNMLNKKSQRSNKWDKVYNWHIPYAILLIIKTNMMVQKDTYFRLPEKQLDL